ncbi:hypothetical protein PHLH8_25080 [Pseudomonas sp. Pc102]|uniref:hypothetical protein n=1 Tax=Pseudomonas sp. Pc102 TaxID=2678261 RepID=UPI001BCDC672|nr:hypothetical protein [Pseudomonas sp. Pc102]BBP82866.1 hypothetical protein PHLH8_25080 [Pseudomonas sp. Pc102]
MSTPPPENKQIPDWHTTLSPAEYEDILASIEQQEEELEEQEKAHQAWLAEEERRKERHALEIEAYLAEEELKQAKAKKLKETKLVYNKITAILSATISGFLFYLIINDGTPTDAVRILAENGYKFILGAMASFAALYSLNKMSIFFEDDTGTFQDIDKKRARKNVAEKLKSTEIPVKPSPDTMQINAEPLKHSVISDESSSFERHIKEIVASLDNQIATAEEKSSKLLDKGTMYLRRGIYFYVTTIIIWQIVIWWKGLGGHVWLGVASCSLTFIVIEFLAAWYLKQYRNYVDSSVSYLRAKSVFNRYLLSYHAINENRLHGFEQHKESLLKVLEEEIQWPDLKDINKNDFNYMVEAINSFHSLLDKINIKTKNTTTPI